MLKGLQALRPRSEFLDQLGEDDLTVLARKMQEVRCAGGEVLYETGAAGDSVYLGQEGSVTLERASQPESLGGREDHKDGQLVGEIGFSTGTWRKLQLMALLRMRQEQLAQQLAACSARSGNCCLRHAGGQ